MTAITVNQATIEKALAAHLMGDAISNPETRDQLISDIVTRLLKQPEREHDKVSLVEKYVKEALGKQVRETAKAWLESESAQEIILTAIKDTLGTDYIKALLEQSAKTIAERIARGY